jgi:hypothetical protein
MYKNRVFPGLNGRVEPRLIRREPEVKKVGWGW